MLIFIYFIIRLYSLGSYKKFSYNGKMLNDEINSLLIYAIKINIF